MDRDYRQNPLLVGALLLSLLLHLLLLLLTTQLGTSQPETRSQPVFVEILPPERRDRDRELELPRRPPPPRPRETPARRLGPQDQVAERETAPPGEDAEDRRRSVRTPQSRPQPQRSAPAAQPRPPAPTASPDVPQAPPSPSGIRPAPETAPARRPSLDELTTLAPTTLAKLESDWRRKLREGVQKGDTVWLDTEQDLLISFFRRFKANIYNVWNYPSGARQRGEEGRCLLRIVVSRQGTIDSVDLLESSGSRELDEEAMRAVRKGQPYGALPGAYPHPQLNIMGYFSYTLSHSRPFVYGGQR